MTKLAGMIWIMLGTVLAGVAMLVIVATPQFADQAMTYIPIACGAAIVIAIPIAWIIARRIENQTRRAA
ncbi:MAG: hypothetical protein F9K44_14020 [Hyphomicrobiaceae bacterium]|nr:MAG: hypothetical protein F9K44_14020 [Hyphomicrobiaceae bacterium]